MIQTEWDLNGHFYNGVDDTRLKDDVELYVKNVDDFHDKYNGRVASLTDDGFLLFLEELSDLNDDSKVSIYMGLITSLETQDQNAMRMAHKLSKISSQCSEKLVFIDEEYKKMGYERILHLANDPRFYNFKNYLMGEADGLKYALSEKEEKLIIKLAGAFSDGMRDELVGSYEFDFRGEKLSLEEVRIKRESSDRSVRLDAYRSLASVFGSKQNLIALGSSYAGVCKGSVVDNEIRGFTTVMESANIGEELSNATVDDLIDTVSEAYPMYHEFLRSKAEFLGIDDFSAHDVFAPLGSVNDKKMPFEEGWAIYLDAMGKVDPMMHDYSKELFEDGRASVFPKKGKAGGAFASYDHGVNEFTMLNWTDTMSDLTTLAHELGHCLHGRLAKKQKSLVYGVPMTLAETASIFNETLMFEHLLKQDIDPQRKREMIASRLDDIFGTIFRQIMYTRFERSCHESFARNEPLTHEDFNRMWLEEVKALYGPDVKIDAELMENGWSSIPHIFHTPFYCYTYAFGNLISLNLVKQYKMAENKQEFLSKYHRFLTAGGSKRPEDLLWDTFELRMDKQFYETGLQSIRDLMLMLKEPIAA